MVVAVSIFTLFRVRSISQRVAALEQSQAVRRPSKTDSVLLHPINRPVPRNEPPDGSSYTIEPVVDGDTARIRFKEETISMRIIGIDTPETVHFIVIRCLLSQLNST